MFFKITENQKIHNVGILSMGHTTGNENGFKKVRHTDFIRDIISNKAREELFGHLWPFTNEEIQKVADEWESKTGVGDRLFFYGPTWKMGYYAALMCLENANVTISEIDCIITTTNTPGESNDNRHQGFPSSADSIMNEFSVSKSKVSGKSNAFCMNVQEACTGSAHGLSIAYAYIALGMCKKVLVIMPENCTHLIKPDKWKKGSNLFGAGAGAVLLSASEDNSFLFFEINCNPYKDNLTAIYSDEKDEGDFDQRGKDVLNYVAGKMPQTIKQSAEAAGITPEDVGFLIIHQPSGRLMATFKDNVEKRWAEFKGQIPEEQGVGNISSASTIVLMSKLFYSGMIRENDIVFLAPFGAGLSGAVIGIRMPKRLK